MTHQKDISTHIPKTTNNQPITIKDGANLQKTKNHIFINNHS